MDQEIKKTNHKITFQSVDMDWREGLPLGNGCLGSVTWFEKGNFFSAYNHYDIYYHPFSGLKPDWDPGEYTALKERAKQAAADQPYQTALFGAFSPIGSPGENLPSAGEVCYRVSPTLENADTSLCLDIEAATLHFSVKSHQGMLECRERILPSLPISVTDFRQTGTNLLEAITLSYPAFRPEQKEEILFEQLSPDCFAMRVTLPNTPKVSGKPFCFYHIVYLKGASGVLHREDRSAHIALTQIQPDFQVYSGIFTNLTYADPKKEGTALLFQTACSLPDVLKRHKHFWESCFSASSIQLPNQFLETLWYFDLYLFKCSSGAGGVYRKQASGLHALWDIRKPTQWRSSWYWDINIQASYWPFYTANHLELAKVFCDGFLEHVKDIEAYTKTYCQARGLAIDYPHTFYNCIGPWCCQFLWWYFEYTQDIGFLKKAYPVFCAEIEYAKSIMEWDASAQSHSIFPDISPEQGPIAKNSTITISCLAYLLRFTIQAGKFLGEQDQVLKEFNDLLHSLPEYRTAQTTDFGTILCDSDRAAPGSPLRHPSLLMPIYPIGEWNTQKPQNIQDCMKNTVRYAFDRTEYGTFGFGWIACAAARTGDGELALRALTELGIDLHLRANGMPAEETNRWRNYCLIHKAPRYYPAMQEAAGETMATLNEMLLQCHSGIIDIFPAIPKTWNNCSFQRLLAKGGFEISAARRNGKTVWINIKSLLGSPLSLYLPDTLSPIGKSSVLQLGTVAGSVYTWGTEPEDTRQAAQIPLMHQSHTGEHLFLGKNKDSAFWSEIDDFLCDKYSANTRIQQQLASLYLFGAKSNSGFIIPKHFQGCRVPFTAVPKPKAFTVQNGYGFLDCNGLAVHTKQGEVPFDSYFSALYPVTFRIDLPKGRYAFLICGEFLNKKAKIKLCAAGFSTHSNLIRSGNTAVQLFLPLSEDTVADIYLEGFCRLYGIFVKRI